MDDFTPEEWAQARRYALVLRWDDADQIWVVRAPELLSDEITHGRTVEEAIAQGEDAVASVLTAMPDYAASHPPRAEVKGGRFVVAQAPRFDAEGVRAIRKQLDLSQEAF